MSLKSKLRELMRSYLISRKAWVSEQAAPSGAPVIITSESGTYTAPSDGYILARAQATDENGWVDISGDIGSTSVLKSADQNTQVFVPIRKGEAAVVNFGASMTNKVVAFVSTVGGGGNAFRLVSVNGCFAGGAAWRLDPFYANLAKHLLGLPCQTILTQLLSAESAQRRLHTRIPLQKTDIFKCGRSWKGVTRTLTQTYGSAIQYFKLILAHTARMSAESFPSRRGIRPQLCSTPMAPLFKTAVSYSFPVCCPAKVILRSAA